MKINIAGQKIQIGQALQTHVNETLPEKLEKYWHKITSVHVNFSQVKGSLFLTQIIVHLGTGTHATIKSSGQGYNIYASYDEALEKAKKQVVKFKDKIEDHQKMSSEERDELLVKNGYKYVIDNQDEAGFDNSPVIVSEKSTDIRKLSLAEAVFTMNVLDLPALMFIDKKTGTIGTVYHRKDGDISWVDSKIKD